MFQFEKVVCISLDRCEPRWQRFQAKLPCDWPFRYPERYPAIDGHTVTVPAWWPAGRGAYGCYLSHLKILEQCLSQNIDSCLILEDDAVCCEDFSMTAIRFMKSLPSDWEMVYFGGQHLSMKMHPPVKVNSRVFVPYNVNRTHAYAVRGRGAIKRLISHLQDHQNWQTGHHIDHHFGQLISQRQFPVYCPDTWLIGQDNGPSSIAGRDWQRRFFRPAQEAKFAYSDLVLILAERRHDAATLIRLLGDHDVLSPNSLPSTQECTAIASPCVGTALELNEICLEYMQRTSSGLPAWEGALRCRLAHWIRYLTVMAFERKTFATAWAPQLSAWLHLIQPLFDVPTTHTLKLICVDQPLPAGPSQRESCRFAILCSKSF